MSWRRRRREASTVFDYMRARLHRRLFMWFGATIFLSTLFSAVIVTFVGSPHRRWTERLEGIERFAEGRFVEVWSSPPKRASLASAIVKDLAIPIVLRDADGRLLGRYGGACQQDPHRVEVRQEQRLLGTIDACLDAYQFSDRPMTWAMVVAAVILWVGSRFIARWITRPLAELVTVAGELGSGNLAARLRLGKFERTELGILANAVNEMASRIEKQLHDQRELLAAVSHEIRTPLGHLRVLLETAQEGRGASPSVLEEMEAEIVAIDVMVGQLLANSRVEFGTLETRGLVGADLAISAVERASLDPTILNVRAHDTRLEGDAASLLAALANLLRNGEEHGDGVETLEVEADDTFVRFSVDDRGSGFTREALARCFDSFSRGTGRAGSLGLGLSLVQRIARAHGGEAYAENRPDGGARVGFSVVRRRELEQG